jgi:transcriptional regulator of acetoin/glycerol metabolism
VVSKDIGQLIDHFLGSDWTIDDEARKALLSYRWPGNVRQLINVLERARILADDGEIGLDDLPREIVPPKSADATSSGVSVTTPGEHSSARLDDMERAHIARVLSDHHGNKTHAANALGIPRRKLYRMLERLRIDPLEFLA